MRTDMRGDLAHGSLNGITELRYVGGETVKFCYGG